MTYVFQFMIIIFVSFLGEVLNAFIPLPVPASVWGMCIMFLALFTGIVKLEKVEKVADFFLSFIAILFVPFGVSVLESFELMKEHIIPILIISFLSFLICFCVTGKVADFIISKKEEKNKNE